MRAGGTLDLDALTDDLSQIADGNYATTSLVQLPLDPLWSAVSNATFNLAGFRADQMLAATNQNPVIGTIQPVRFSLQQPANSIHLIWDALDANGNYQCSYPINSAANYVPGFLGGSTLVLSPSGIAFRYNNAKAVQAAGAGLGQPLWARGFMRLNGSGIWFPMSLYPATDSIPANVASTNAVSGGASGAGIINGQSGFSSLSGPISFFDWVGLWDGNGDYTDGPNGPNLFILAMITTNLSLSSNRGSHGSSNNYAVPNSSGRKQATVSQTQSQKNSDILVPVGGRKRGCD